MNPVLTRDWLQGIGTSELKGGHGSCTRSSASSCPVSRGHHTSFLHTPHLADVCGSVSSRVSSGQAISFLMDLLKLQVVFSRT